MFLHIKEVGKVALLILHGFSISQIFQKAFPQIFIFFLFGKKITSNCQFTKPIKMNTKSVIFLAALVASTNAYTISAAQTKQLDIIFKDVKDNLASYIALVLNPNSGITFSNLPAGLINVGASLVDNPKDTPNYSEVDINAVSTFITKVPWFSNRLEPELEAAGVPMIPVTSSSYSRQYTTLTQSQLL